MCDVIHKAGMCNSSVCYVMSHSFFLSCSSMVTSEPIMPHPEFKFESRKSSKKTSYCTDTGLATLGNLPTEIHYLHRLLSQINFCLHLGFPLTNSADVRNDSVSVAWLVRPWKGKSVSVEKPNIM